MNHAANRIGGANRRALEASGAIVRVGLPALMVLAPLWFGGVTSAAIAFLSLGAALVGLALLLHRGLDPDRPRLSLGVPGILGFAFLCVVALQVMPLRPDRIARLSPATARAYALNLPGAGGPADAIRALERQVLPAGALPPDDQGPPQRTLSLDPSGTRVKCLRAAFYLLLFIVALNATPSPLSPAAVILALVVVGTLDAGYGLIEYLSRHQHIFGYAKRYYTDAVTGTYINRNHFAGLMELALPAGLGLALSLRPAEGTAPRRGGLRAVLLRLAQPHTAQGALVVLACAVMAAGLALSFSRAGILLGLFGLALTALLARPSPRRAWRAWPLVFVLAAASIPLYVVGSEQIKERYAALPDDVERVEGRVPVWRQALRMGADFPLAGAGYGSFATVFPSYRPPRTGLYDHAHNDYLELFAETGFTGLGLVLAASLTCLFQVWRARRTAARRERALLAGLVGAMAALLTHGLVDFNGQIPANAALFACVAGIALSLARAPQGIIPRPLPSPAWRGAVRTAVGIVLLLGFTLLAWEDWTERGRHERELRRHRSRLAGAPADLAGRADEALAALAAAPRASHPHPEALALFSRYTLIRVQGGSGEPGGSSARAQGAAAAIHVAYRAARRAMEIQPTRAEHAYLAALALQAAEVHGSLASGQEAGGEEIEELAGRLLAQAARLDPRNPALRHTIGKLYWARGRLEEAVVEFRASLEAGDGFSDAIYTALWQHPDGPGLVARVTPDDSRGRLALARFHHLAGRSAEAEALYRDLARGGSLGPEGSEGLIWVLLRQGRYDEAEAACAEAEERFPTGRERVTLWKGQIAAHRGDHGRAVQHFEAALRADPASEEIQWALARAFCELGDDQPCIARLTFLLDEGSRVFRDRREKQARLLLARALERQGRLQDSLVQYLIVGTLDPHDRDVEPAVERLRRAP